jgi:hypothetical protein
LVPAALLFLSLFSFSWVSTPVRAETILYTNDVLGELEPCGCRNNPTGGMARKAALVEKLKSEGPLLQIDAGDLLFEAEQIPDSMHAQAEVQARALLKAHEQLGHQVLVPGEKDFALGLKKWKAITRGSSIQILAANAVDKKSGKPLAKGSQLFRLGKTKVGVIGILGSALNWPKDLRVTAEKPAIERELAKLKKQKPHLILLVTHQGLDADRELISQMKGIDALIGAHSQSFLQKLERGTAAGKDTLLLQSSFRNQWVGVLPVDPKKNQLLAEQHSLLSLDASYDSERDPFAIKTLIAKFKEEVARVNRDAQKAETALLKPSSAAAAFQTFPKCAECHIKQFDFWRQSPHGKSYLALFNQNQAENQSCIGCHSVGYQAPQGWTKLAEPALLAQKSEPTPSGSPSPAMDSPLSPQTLQPYLQALHEEKSLKSRVKLERISSEKIDLLRATAAFKQNWANVQCESCHGAGGEHPFGAAPYPKTVETTTCVKCHSQERAPEWYGKDQKLDPERLAQSLKKASCPAGDVTETELE